MRTLATLTLACAVGGCTSASSGRPRPRAASGPAPVAAPRAREPAPAKAVSLECAPPLKVIFRCAFDQAKQSGVSLCVSSDGGEGIASIELRLRTPDGEARKLTVDDETPVKPTLWTYTRPGTSMNAVRFQAGDHSYTVTSELVEKETNHELRRTEGKRLSCVEPVVADRIDALEYGPVKHIAQQYPY